MTPSSNLRGAGLMTASMAGFALSDACLKALGAELPLFQILVLRGCGTTLVLLAVALALGQGRARLGRRDWTLIALRTLAEMGASWFFITALFVLPLADISAVLQALPLTVTLAGAWLLGERIGRARLAAILVGFGGVLLILRPGGEGFGWPAAYALASMLCVTARDILSRMLPPAAPSLLVAAVTAGGVTAFAGLGSLFVDWAPVGAGAGALLGGTMTFVMLGYVASVSSMRAGELSFVSPFRYTSLLFSIALGAAAFGTRPDGLTLLGAGVVVATGIFTLWHGRARPGGGPAA